MTRKSWKPVSSPLCRQDGEVSDPPRRGRAATRRKLFPQKGVLPRELGGGAPRRSRATCCRLRGEGGGRGPGGASLGGSPGPERKKGVGGAEQRGQVRVRVRVRGWGGADAGPYSKGPRV